MEQLLYRYANLQCTTEEKQLVYEYVEADFSRCFELIRLMKMRAYKELRPDELLFDEEHESCKKIGKKRSSAKSMKPLFNRRKAFGVDWLNDLFADNKEEAIDELMDVGQDKVEEDLLSVSMDEVLPDLIPDEVSVVKEPDLVFGSSPNTLFTASGFLVLLEDYIYSPD